MACTKALSNFSCSTPALPGLINSLWIESTLGGGVVSCAAAMPSPPTSTHAPNSNPVILFMDADLLGREIDWIQIWKGSDPASESGTRSCAESIRVSLPKSSRRPWIGGRGTPVLHQGKGREGGGLQKQENKKQETVISLPTPVPPPTSPECRYLSPEQERPAG